MQSGQIKLLFWGHTLLALLMLGWYGCNSKKNQPIITPEALVFKLDTYKSKFDSCNSLNNNCTLGTHNMHARKLDTLAFYKAFQDTGSSYPKSTAIDEGVYFRCYQDSFKNFNVVWFFTNVIGKATYDEFVTYTKQGKLIDRLEIDSNLLKNSEKWFNRYALINKDTIIVLDSYSPGESEVRNYYLINAAGSFNLIKSDTALPQSKL